MERTLVDDFAMQVARETRVADPEMKVTIVMQRVSQAYPQMPISREHVERWIAGRPIVDTDQEYVLAILSDLHFGKETDRYNSTVAASRLQLYFRELASIPRSPSPVFHILLVGDCVEGEGIYPGQSHGADCPVRNQAKHCTESLKEGLIHLLNRYPNARAEVHSVIGNHGRMSKDASSTSNWDAVVTDLLQQWVEGSGLEERLIVHDVPDSERQLVVIGGKRIFMCHHGTKHLGTPAMKTKWLGWLLKYRFDIAVHGHWHTPGVQYLESGCVVSNGSLSGPDDLSDSMGTYQPAHQGYAVLRNGRMQIGFFKLE